jgi:hypothetical protein
MRHELTMETGALLVGYLRRVARKMCVEPRKARQQRSTWDLEISTRIPAFGHGRPASRWKRPLARRSFPSNRACSHSLLLETAAFRPIRELWFCRSKELFATNAPCPSRFEREELNSHGQACLAYNVTTTQLLVFYRTHATVANDRSCIFKSPWL